jgi:hypothetical protein
MLPVPPLCACIYLLLLIVYFLPHRLRAVDGLGHRNFALKVPSCPSFSLPLKLWLPGRTQKTEKQNKNGRNASGGSPLVVNLNLLAFPNPRRPPPPKATPTSALAGQGPSWTAIDWNLAFSNLRPARCNAADTMRPTRPPPACTVPKSWGKHVASDKLVSLGVQSKRNRQERRDEVLFSQKHSFLPSLFVVTNCFLNPIIATVARFAASESFLCR